MSTGRTGRRDRRFWPVSLSLSCGSGIPRERSKADRPSGVCGRGPWWYSYATPLRCVPHLANVLMCLVSPDMRLQSTIATRRATFLRSGSRAGLLPRHGRVLGPVRIALGLKILCRSQHLVRPYFTDCKGWWGRKFVVVRHCSRILAGCFWNAVNCRN